MGREVDHDIEFLIDLLINNHDMSTRSLHWVPEDGYWELIETYGGFGMGVWLGLAPGVHHFLVVIGDPPVNIIPHKYLIGAFGQIVGDGLTEDERELCDRVMRTWPPDEDDSRKFDEIRIREYFADLPPRSSIPALRHALDVPHPGSRAEEFFAEMETM
jgi:hypothetical protein